MNNGEPLMPLWAAIPLSIYVAVVILGWVVMCNMSESERRNRTSMSTQDLQKARAESFILFWGITVWPVYALWHLPLGIKMAVTGTVSLVKDITAGLKQIRRERNEKD